MKIDKDTKSLLKSIAHGKYSKLEIQKLLAPDFDVKNLTDEQLTKMIKEHLEERPDSMLDENDPMDKELLRLRKELREEGIL